MNLEFDNEKLQLRNCKCWFFDNDYELEKLQVRN